MRRWAKWHNALLTHEAMASEVLIDSPLAHGTAMIRREWLERVGGWHERGWPEDLDLWVRLVRAGARLGIGRTAGLRLADHERLVVDDVFGLEVLLQGFDLFGIATGNDHPEQTLTSTQGLVMWATLKCPWSLRCEARFQGANPTVLSFVAAWQTKLESWRDQFEISVSRKDL